MRNTFVVTLVRALAVICGLSLLDAGVAWGDFDPFSAQRMAVTDSNTAAGIQPIVWMNTSDGPTFKGPTVDWGHPNIAAASSGLAAISFTAGSTQRQRIFYTRSNSLRVLNFDGSVVGTEMNVTPPANTIHSGAVSAITWTNGTTRTVDVAVPATVSGSAGRLCIYRGTFTAAGVLTFGPPACFSSAVINTSLPDIAGVARTSTVAPRFYFRNNSSGLSQVAPNTAGGWTSTVVTTTSIGPSVFATPLGTTGYQFGVVRTSDSRVMVGRFDSDADTTVTWATLPSGPTPGTGSGALLGGLQFGTSTEVTLTTGFTVHRIFRANSASWPTSWTNITNIGGGVLPLGIGAMTTVQGLSFPTNYLIGGYSVSPVANAALLELRREGAITWFDYLKFDRDAAHVLTGSALESSVSLNRGGLGGVVTAIERNNPAPWRVNYAISSDGKGWGAKQFITPEMVGTFGAQMSVTDPVAAGGPDGRYHMLEIHEELITNGCTAVTDPPRTSLVYRQTTSGSFGTALCDGGGSSGCEVLLKGDLDHGGLGVTGDPYAGTQSGVHALVYDVDAGNVKYFSKTTNTSSFTTRTLTSAELPAQPVVVVVSNTDDIAFGYSFPLAGTSQFPRICRLNVGAAPSSCATVGVCSPGTTGCNSDGFFTNRPVARDIPFGTAQATPQFNCAQVGGQNFKCFDTQEPVSIAVDTRTSTPVIVVAYQALVNNLLSIFVTKSTNAAFTTWSTPLAVASTGAHWFDPAVSVDSTGGVVVTFQRIVPAPTSTTGAATVRAIHTTVANLALGFAETSPTTFASWNANGLPFYCRRGRWFVGEYRHPAVAGGRAMHVYPADSGSGLVGQSVSLFSGAGVDDPDQ